MTHDDCRTVKGFDSLFQHFLRGDIEVIGRLIEDKEVYWLKQ